MKPKYFILTGFLSVTIFFSIYIILFFFQLGAPFKAEYWIDNSYQYKDFKAKSIRSKKIIIISGSNSLFGINSTVIQENIGYEVVNLATHASLDIDFLYYKIKEHLNQDDIVLMPLEFEYYSRSEKISNWFSTNMMSWGKDYIKQLSLADLSKFIITTEPNKVLEGVVKNITTNDTNIKILSQKEVIDTLKILWSKDGSEWRGYSYKSLNEYGDINADEQVSYKKNVSYLGKSIKISEHFLNIYDKINKLVKVKHGKLFLTYPVTIKNPSFDLSKNECQKRIQNLETSLNKHDIHIKCNAALFNLDRTYFFNTHYHTNKYGALIRSENLVDCLHELINDTDKELSYSEAINQTNMLQKKYINSVKKE